MFTRKNNQNIAKNAAKHVVNPFNRGNMLPFLKNNNKRMLTKLMDRRSNTENLVNDPVESTTHPDHNPELEAAASKLMSGIETKSLQSIRDALRDAFKVLDAEPHEEGPHTNEDES